MSLPSMSLSARFGRSTPARATGMEETLAARDVVLDLLHDKPWRRGVGIGRNSDGTHSVEVLVEEVTPDVLQQIPSEVRGTRVNVRQVGDIVAAPAGHMPTALWVDDSGDESRFGNQGTSTMHLSGVTGSFGRDVAEPQAEACRVGLPSSSSVEDLLDGDASAIWPVLGSMAGRAALVGLGAAAAGLRGGNIVRAGIGGAVMIEAFVFAWIATHRKPKP